MSIKRIHDFEEYKAEKELKKDLAEVRERNPVETANTVCFDDPEEDEEVNKKSILVEVEENHGPLVEVIPGLFVETDDEDKDP